MAALVDSTNALVVIWRVTYAQELSVLLGCSAKGVQAANSTAAAISSACQHLFLRLPCLPQALSVHPGHQSKPTAASKVFTYPAPMLASAAAVVRAAFSSASKTTEVRSAHALDASALCSYLATSLPQFEWSESALHLRQFSHGQSNPTYTLNTASGETLVLRKQPPGKILRGAHAVDREATVMTALHGVVPVPNVVHYEGDSSILGTPFFLYRYVDGMHVPDSEAAALDPAQRRSVFRSMADTLAT